MRLPAEETETEDDGRILTLESDIPEEIGIEPLVSPVEFSLLTSSHRRHSLRASTSRALSFGKPRNSAAQAGKFSLSKSWKFRARKAERLNDMFTSLPLSVVGPANASAGATTLPSTPTFVVTPPVAPTTTGPGYSTPGSNGTGISFTPSASAADAFTPVPEPGTLGIFGLGLALATFGSRAIGRRVARPRPSPPSLN